MAGTKRGYRFVRRATAENDSMALTGEKGEASLLQLKDNWQNKSRLLQEDGNSATSAVAAATAAAYAVPVPTSRFYRQTVSELAYRPEAMLNSPSAYQNVLRGRRDQSTMLRDVYQQRIDYLNYERESMLLRRNALREQRRQFDSKPLTPPFVDDGLPKTFQYRWEKIGSREPGDPENYRLKHPDPVKETVYQTRTNLANEEAHVRKRKLSLMRRREYMQRPYAGELGINTYEPWQLASYHTCRRIVEDEIGRVLDLIFGEKHESVEGLSRDMQGAIWSGAEQLICEELVLEVTGELSLLASREFAYLHGMAANLGDQSCMRQAEAIITGVATGRKPNDQLYDTVVKTFYKLKRSREKEKPLLWRHEAKKSIARTVTRPTAAVVTAAPQLPVVTTPQVEDTSELIDYTLLLPWDTRLQLNERIEPDYVAKKNIIKLKKFARLELRYWSKITCTYTGVPLLGSTGGFSCIAVANDNNLVAVGTMSGDLLVYNFERSFKGGNFAAIRYTPGPSQQPGEARGKRKNPESTGRRPATVDSLAWSTDGGSLVSVHADGSVRAWLVHYAPLPPNSNPETTPLNLIGDLPAGDMRFTEGPYVTAGTAEARPDDQWQALSGAFFPAFTALGSQPHFCLAMSTNHVLKLDTEQLLTDVQDSQSLVLKQPRLRDPKRPQHRLTQLKLDCELFVEHKQRIVLMSAIENTGDFFTVDADGYLAVWRYRAEYIADARRGMRPIKVYRVRMDKENYRPDNATPAMVRFDAENYDPETERELLAEARRRADAEARRNLLRYPWRTITEFSQVTTIYKSPLEVIKQSGGAFHEVTRLKVDNRMMRYITRVYKPYTFAAELFLGARVNRTGTRVVCLVLFPTDPEDIPFHIEVCVVDLVSMKAVDPRITIPLSDKEYAELQQSGYVNFDIVSSFNYTMSEYMVTNIMGTVSYYSLTTGQRVAMTISPQVAEAQNYRGCVIGRTLLTSHHANCLHSVANRYDTGLLVYRPGALTARMLILQDGNTEADRRNLADLLRSFDWINKTERGARSNSDSLYLRESDHAAAFCMDIVFDMVDRAVQRSRGVTFTAQTINEHESINRLRSYELLQGRVESLRRRQQYPGPPPATDYVKRTPPAAALPTAENAAAATDQPQNAEGGERQ